MSTSTRSSGTGGSLGSGPRVPAQRSPLAPSRPVPLPRPAPLPATGKAGPIRTGAFLLCAQFPGQGHAGALDRAVSAAVEAERAGLDSVGLAEHHFVPYGVCPSATTLAALLLGRTRRIRVG